jgi:hypothetical protein
VSLSPLLARVVAAQVLPEAARVRSVRSLIAPDLACNIDGTMPALRTVPRRPGAPSRVTPALTVRVRRHPRRETAEVRLLHARPKGGPLRVGTLSLPLGLWLHAWRPLLLHAAGAGLIDLTLEE